MPPVSAVDVVLRRVGAWGGGRWPALAGFGLMAAVAASLLVFVDAYIPYNDDEFILFHIVRCSLYPASDVGDGYCNDLMLNVYGSAITLPLRVYHYSGSFPVLYYMPLFLLLRDAIAVRISGLAGLLFGAFLVARVHRLPAWTVMLFALLIFPYAYQHLVDTGPVAVTTLLFFLCYATIASWMRSPRAWLLYALAVLLFCGVWTKLTFLWYAPVIASFVAYALFVRRPPIRSFLPHAVGSAAMFLLLASVVFLATSPGNPSSRPYLDQVVHAQSRSFRDMFRGDWTQSGAWNAVMNPMEATQRTFFVTEPGPREQSFVFLLYGLPLLCVLVALLAARGNPRAVRKSELALGTYGLFFLMLFVILRSKEAWAMHHVVLAFPLLILSYVFCYDALRALASTARGRAVVGAIAATFLLSLAFFTVSFFASTTLQLMRDSEHPSKAAINARLYDETLGREYTYVVASWGMMFYQGLLGPPEQSVVWKTHGISREDLQALMDAAHARGRKVLLIHLRDHNVAQFARDVGFVTCGTDEPWVVTAEPSDDLPRVFGKCW